MTRDAGSIAHEIDYWKATLQDINELSDMIAETAKEMTPIPFKLLALDIDGAAVCVSEAMERLLRLYDPIERMLCLAEGRATVLNEEWAASR